MRFVELAIYLAVLGIVLMSCTDQYVPPGTPEATNFLVQKTFLTSQLNPNGWSGKIGLFGVDESKIVDSAQACQGAAGSILPPLSVKECFSHLPTHILLSALDRMGLGRQSTSNRHVELYGIERYFKQQFVSTDCWAAVLETGREFLGLTDIPQHSLIASSPKICPSFNPQGKGATMYQILYIVSAIKVQLHEHAASSYTCDTALCVVQALMRNRPVMMLNADHAVLVTGANFVSAQADPSTDENFTLNNLEVLDPAEATTLSAHKIEDWSNICVTDGFIVL